MTFERGPIVLFVGRLHPVKGLQPLLDAWVRVWPSYTNWRLQLVGDDPLGMQPSLERRLRGMLQPDAVQFLGARSRAELVGLYDRASVFVLPSFTEVMGMANLEAAARGVPILTTKGTGLDLLAPYGAGIVCSSTTASIAAGLETLMGMPEMWRRRMGLAALRMAEEHLKWDRVATQFESLYRVAFRSPLSHSEAVS
jgi:glycosyltransferase involved in cell wall biosynthesis